MPHKRKSSCSEAASEQEPIGDKPKHGRPCGANFRALNVIYAQVSGPCVKLGLKKSCRLGNLVVKVADEEGAVDAKALDPQDTVLTKSTLRRKCAGPDDIAEDEELPPGEIYMGVTFRDLRKTEEDRVANENKALGFAKERGWEEPVKLLAKAILSIGWDNRPLIDELHSLDKEHDRLEEEKSAAPEAELVSQLDEALEACSQQRDQVEQSIKAIVVAVLRGDAPPPQGSEHLAAEDTPLVAHPTVAFTGRVTRSWAARIQTSPDDMDVALVPTPGAGPERVAAAEEDPMDIDEEPVVSDAAVQTPTGAAAAEASAGADAPLDADAAALLDSVDVDKMADDLFATLHGPLLEQFMEKSMEEAGAGAGAGAGALAFTPGPTLDNGELIWTDNVKFYQHT